MISLEGSAAEILKDIDEQSPTLYQDIWRALSKRFGEVDEQRESMKRFEQRRQNDSETVVEFDQALRNLYRKAWPKSTAQQKEVALKTRFEDGLQNLDMQQYLRLHAVSDTYEQTVQKARRFAAAIDAPKPKRSVRIATLPPAAVHNISDSCWQDRMDKIEGMIRSLQVKSDRSSTPSPNSSSMKGSNDKQPRTPPRSPDERSLRDSNREERRANRDERDYARPSNYQSRSPTPNRQSSQQSNYGS